MTRDQVRAIIGAGATDEQINAILNAHSADIGDLRRTLEAGKQNADDLTAQLNAAKDTIARLEQAGADTDKLRAEVEQYKAAETKRLEAEQAAATEKRIAERFDTATEKLKFVNGYTRDGVYAQFRAALADQSNAGQSDADVLTALIKDKPDLLANPNPPIPVPGVMPINNQVLTTEAFKALPLADRMKWANANPEIYARISDMLKG